jgi:hypothetical protein
LKVAVVPQLRSLPGDALRFLAAFGPICGHFRPGRHRLSAPRYRQELANRFRTWREVTGLAAAGTAGTAGTFPKPWQRAGSRARPRRITARRALK